MADGDGRITVQKQKRHRLANDVAAANDDGVAPANRNLLALEQFDDACRRTGNELWTILREQPDALCAEPVHILVSRDRVEDLLLCAGAHRLRQRRLHENAVDSGALVESIDHCQDIGERRRFRHAFKIDPEPNVAASLHLVSNVNLRRRIVTDEHDAEPGLAAMLLHELRNLRLDLLLHARCERLSVQYPCGHRSPRKSYAASRLCCRAYPK